MERRRLLEFYVKLMSECQFNEECVAEELAKMMRNAMEAIIKDEVPKRIDTLKDYARDFLEVVDLFWMYYYGDHTRKWWE